MRTSVPGTSSRFKPLAPSVEALGNSTGSTRTGAAGAAALPPPIAVSSKASAAWPVRTSAAAAILYFVGLIARPRRLLLSDSTHLCSSYIALGIPQDKPASTRDRPFPANPQQGVPLRPCYPNSTTTSP